jgi:KDO2-lipid IV(A) lauroyltransferase
MRSYARYWLEAFRLPSLPTRAVLDGMVLENSELLFDAVAAGRGVIGALPHSANWDHAGAWACAQDLPLTTVAERLKPESLYRRFVAYREGLGMEILPTSGGAQPPLDILTSRLEQGRVVVLLADRDLSSRGIEVNFFGGRTRMPAGPALLALRTGAPLLVVSLWYDDKILRARIHPAVGVPSQGNTREKLSAMTQAMADEFAHGIAAHPQDWHMMQRLWLERERAAAADISSPGSPA